jgi:putative alpha-1,2-mannosidase
VSAENIYVGSATLNGKLLNRAWLRHAEIADGGRLVLTMSAKPGNWAQHDLPPAP